jgi:galactosyl transferase GMA12/MNN10 family
VARSKALCTVATGPFVELLEITRPTFETFARRHGWELVVVREDRSAGRPAAWAKVPIVRDLLADHDVVAWIDADAVIVDDTVNLVSELRPFKRLYLVEHHNEPSGEVTANTGVLMLRAGRWTNSFLDAVWAQEDLINHRWWENAAIMRLLGYRIDPQPAGRERRPAGSGACGSSTSPGTACRTGMAARRRVSRTTRDSRSSSAESECSRTSLRATRRLEAPSARRDSPACALRRRPREPRARPS